MTLNVVLVGDHLQEAVFMRTSKEVKDCSYIDKYKKCLNSLVPSKLSSYDNDCFTTYTDIINGHYFVIPKTSRHISKYYQRAMPGTNVLVYFVNMNEQKNYAWKTLQKWNTSLNMTKFKVPPSNPHHIHKSYQLFQRMMLGIPRFIYPPKYLCIVLCGAQKRAHFTERKNLVMDVYSRIIYEKCQWEKTKTLFIVDLAFNNGSIPSHALHVKLMDMIQKSISQNSPEIIGKKNENETKQEELEENQHLIASIFNNIITETKTDEYVELIMFCSILHGYMKTNDSLILHPANIEVNILDMKCHTGKMSVKIRINYSLWRKLKKLHKRKHFLLSKDCIKSFKWNHIHTQSYCHKNNICRQYYHSEDGIVIKLYLSSKNNYQTGIYRNQELLVLYLGHTYPVKVIHFGDTAKPSIDTIFEWKVLYDMVKKLWNIKLSIDSIRNIFYFIYNTEELNRKIGLMQHTKSMNVNVDPICPITFSLVKPFNKFCVLARNEIVAKGKFIGICKLKKDVNLDASIFNLTDLEKRYILFKWIRNIRSYSKMQLIHRGSRDGFDTASFEKNCENKRSTLCIIQSAETGEIFGGYHHMPIPSGYGYRVLRYWNVMNFKKEWDYQAFIFMLRMNNSTPCMFRFGDNYKQQIYPHIHVTNYYGIDTRPGIRFGKGCYLINQCDTNLSCWMPQQSAFQHPQNDITEWNKITFPQHFTTKDYEIWQLIQ
eukprot:415852_1